MNSILLGLPEEYEGIPLSTDYRNMIQADMALHDPELSDWERTYTALTLLYPQPPADAALAVRGLLWFLRRGRDIRADASSGGSAPRAIDFDADADYIYAAFHAVYGIDLAEVEYLHWWSFMALLEGLPDDTMIKRIMYWRTAELDELPDYERKHVLRMRSRYALPASAPELSPEERSRRTKERLDQRYAEAQAACK